MSLEYGDAPANTYVTGCMGDPTSLMIPNSVTGIGAGAFQECSNLVSIVLPTSIRSIEPPALTLCSNLASVTLGQGVLNFVSSSDGGPLNIFPPSVVSVVLDDTVTYISSNAFALMSITSMVIPASVTSIGEAAFSSCTELTSIVIPAAVRSIGDYAFSGAGLRSIIFNGTSQCTSIGRQAFCETQLTSINIPASVTSVGDVAFEGCSDLARVTIGYNSRIGYRLVVGEGCFYASSSIVLNSLYVWKYSNGATVNLSGLTGNVVNNKTLVASSLAALPKSPAFTLSKPVGSSLNAAITRASGLVYQLAITPGSGQWVYPPGNIYNINTANLTANTTYTVSVKAATSIDGPWSNPTTRTFLTLPATPLSMTVSSSTATSTALSMPLTLSGVSYYSSTTLLGKRVLIKNNTVVGLKANTSYTVHIWAKNNTGYSLDPLPLSFTTAPAAPAVTVSNVTPSGATLTIRNPINGLSYRYSYTAPGQSVGISDLFNGSSIAITSLLPNKSYTYYVTASNDYPSLRTKVTFKTARTPAAPRTVMLPRVYLYGNH